MELMKKKLASCTSLAQLREALARADKSKAKLKQVAAQSKGKAVDKEEVKQREVRQIYKLLSLSLRFMGMRTCCPPESHYNIVFGSHIKNHFLRSLLSVGE